MSVRNDPEATWETVLERRAAQDGDEPAPFSSLGLREAVALVLPTPQMAPPPSPTTKRGSLRDWGHFEFERGLAGLPLATETSGVVMPDGWELALIGRDQA